MALKTWIEYDGENDVCAIAFKVDRSKNSTYFRIADIPFEKMNKILEKYEKDFGQIARIRLQDSRGDRQ